ncbi:MAG: hypothetical protein U5K72_03265 [Balneolaceae bacterium]|nr:hypothetical protein [Balneolaceae bacterium]
MNKFIETDCEVIRITFVNEDKQDEPLERYILAQDLKTAINIFKAYSKDWENPILINKAEFVSTMALCDVQRISDKFNKNSEYW